MDKYQRWTGVYWSIPQVLKAWRARQKRGQSNKRMSEIQAAAWLAMCLSAHNEREYAVGMPLRGHTDEQYTCDDLFTAGVGMDEDVDLVLAPMKNDLPVQELAHPVQIVRVVRQQLLNSERLARFVIEKKFAVPTDERLILLVHIEQDGRIDYFEVSRLLASRGCPYGQIFLMGKYSTIEHKRWFCVQVHPKVEKLQDLDFSHLDRVNATRSPLDPQT